MVSPRFSLVGYPLSPYPKFVASPNFAFNFASNLSRVRTWSLISRRFSLVRYPISAYPKFVTSPYIGFNMTAFQPRQIPHLGVPEICRRSVLRLSTDAVSASMDTPSQRTQNLSRVPTPALIWPRFSLVGYPLSAYPKFVAGPYSGFNLTAFQPRWIPHLSALFSSISCRLISA